MMAACAAALWACDNGDDGGVSGLRLEPSDLGVLAAGNDTVVVKTNVPALTVQTFAFTTPAMIGSVEVGTASRQIDEVLTPGHDVECCYWLKLSMDEQKNVYVITEPQLSSTSDLGFMVEVSHDGDVSRILGVKPFEEPTFEPVTDKIGLSVKEMNFAAAGGTCEATAQGRNWWLVGVRVDGVLREIDDTLEEASGSIQVDWLTITYSDRAVIAITAEPNTTGVERSFVLTLESFDYFDHIQGRQAAR